MERMQTFTLTRIYSYSSGCGRGCGRDCGRGCGCGTQQQHSSVASNACAPVIDEDSCTTVMHVLYVLRSHHTPLARRPGNTTRPHYHVKTLTMRHTLYAKYHATLTYSSYLMIQAEIDHKCPMEKWRTGLPHIRQVLLFLLMIRDFF